MPHFDAGIALSQFVGSLPTFIAVILAWLHSNARTGDINGHLGQRISDTNARFDKRMDDLREFIRAENEATRAGFRRVEEVMDARLKHLEDER